MTPPGPLSLTAWTLGPCQIAVIPHDPSTASPAFNHLLQAPPSLGPVALPGPHLTCSPERLALPCSQDPHQKFAAL